MAHIVRRHAVDRIVKDAALSLLLRQTSGRNAASAWLNKAGRQLLAVHIPPTRNWRRMPSPWLWSEPLAATHWLVSACWRNWLDGPLRKAAASRGIILPPTRRS